MNTPTAATSQRVVPSDDVRAYARWVRRQKAYRRWQPFVDAQPARGHLFHLMATTGAGWRTLADEAGVPRSTVTYILYGNSGRRATRCTPGNAQRLLALRAEPRQAARIDATGTRRRIQVLMGEGWPQTRLGPQFGTHTHYVHELLKAERVAATTAKAVADAYIRLADVDPLECGVTLHGRNLARRLATQRGWRDRLFWEDYDRIDDPDFNPATVDRPLKRDELGAA